MNQYILEAVISELDVLRFTPAGIPIQDLVLEHSSEVIEAGQPRKVQVTLRARAVGQLAYELEKRVPGDTVEIKGFIAQGRKDTFQICFHIQAWRLR
ncbi:primosomal replication protein N [Basilea psittacipulmonis]|uniref:Replication restart protein PriB n=1 Tax=Basilea psittacipulmonis DSM 24701 TaxID=1072685 RepID=A0A077DGC9_9BURK|nr:primosomal replication protein N [Basilea psittacipulmonis]AIL32532.1 hypothetical protein IX83_03725 [Basilea psittacipulmonis DSM 24701]